jgi:Ala-tRNA(Pro) deacylase
MSESRLYADLSLLEIEYELVEHEAVFTVEQSSKLDREIPGAHTKNLFLKDAAGQYWLVTVPAHMRVDLKQLPDAIGSKRVGFGKAEDMQRLLDIRPGSVTPLAAINDDQGAVAVVIDERLIEAERINVHPLRNTATISLSPQKLVKLLEHWQHMPLKVCIPSVD